MIEGPNFPSMFPCIAGLCVRTFPRCFRALRACVFCESTSLQSCQQDPMMTMKAAVESIQEKANTGHSLALAVSYSLCYDKHHSNPHPLQLASRNASTVETLCPPTLPTLPLIISDESQLQRYRLVSTGPSAPHIMRIHIPCGFHSCHDPG